MTGKQKGVKLNAVLNCDLEKLFMFTHNIIVKMGNQRSECASGKMWSILTWEIWIFYGIDVNSFLYYINFTFVISSVEITNGIFATTALPPNFDSTMTNLCDNYQFFYLGVNPCYTHSSFYTWHPVIPSHNRRFSHNNCQTYPNVIAWYVFRCLVKLFSENVGFACIVLDRFRTVFEKFSC